MLRMTERKSENYEKGQLQKSGTLEKLITKICILGIIWLIQ